MSKYFYHGTGYDGLGISTTLEILKTGAIKCRRLLGERECGYNGLDYVSICKKYLEADDPKTKSAFYCFIQNHFCFIISNKIDAIKTNPSGSIHCLKYSDFLLKDTSERISDLFDEWQVYQEIPLSMIVGVGIPLEVIPSMLKRSSGSTIAKRLKEIIRIANTLGLDIVDTSVQGFVEEYERKKRESDIKIYQIAKKLEEVLAHE